MKKTKSKPQNAPQEKAGGDRPNTPCSPSSTHDKEWGTALILPIAKVMKDRGIAHLMITLRDDGKAAYVLEPVEAECLGCRADIAPENA